MEREHKGILKKLYRVGKIATLGALGFSMVLQAEFSAIGYLSSHSLLYNRTGERAYYSGQLSPTSPNEFSDTSLQAALDREFDLEFLIETHRFIRQSAIQFDKELTGQGYDKSRKVESLEELEHILRDTLPYITQEFDAKVNIPNIEIVPVTKDNIFSAWYSNRGNIARFREDSLAYHGIPSIIGHEVGWHAQEYFSYRNYWKKPFFTAFLRRFGQDGNKYSNEGLATLFGNEISANIALDGRTDIAWNLAGRLANDIEALAYETAVNTNNTDRFIEAFDPRREKLADLTKRVFGEGQNNWLSYAKPSIIAFLSGIEQDSPLNISGIMTDGLYRFWRLVKSQYENQEIVERKDIFPKQGTSLQQELNPHMYGANGTLKPKYAHRKLGL